MSIQPNTSTPQQHLPFGDRAILNMLNVNCRLRGYKVDLAVTADDWAAHTSLVQSAFFDIGFFSNLQTPMQKMPAESISHVWVVRFRGKPVGTIRIVQDARQLPIDRRLNVFWPDHVSRWQAAEIGRFAIARSHRRRRFVVTYALLAAAFAHSRAHAIRWWVGCAPSPLLQSLRQHAPHVQLLDTRAMEAAHVAQHRGRESYFSATQAIRPFLLELHRVSMAPIASNIVRQRIRRGTLMRYHKPAA